MKQIQLFQVKKAFNQGRPNEFWAIRGVDLTIQPNRATVLKGPSGSGKTTLLSMIGCLSRPTSGRITLGDESLSGLPERFMTDIRRRRFGFIFQQFNLIKGLTVLENVMLPAYPLGPDHGRLKNSAMDLLHRFGLGAKAESRVEWLSGGEAQRTAICRALINDPETLIADEPTTALDVTVQREILNLLAELSQKVNLSVLMITHNFGIVSDLAERVYVMQKGRIVEEGKTEKILYDPQHEYTQQLMAAVPRLYPTGSSTK